MFSSHFFEINLPKIRKQLQNLFCAKLQLDNIIAINTTAAVDAYFAVPCTRAMISSATERGASS